MRLSAKRQYEMTNEPLWRLVHECAHKLTRAGRVPFTRADLIACVRKSRPKCNEDSVNPIIQGLTDNLRGGAPGADGKKLLHSVGRGRFILARTHAMTSRDEPSRKAESATPRAVSTASSSPIELPTTENELRDMLVGRLREKFSTSTYSVEAEGTLPYTLPNGKELRHASDILVTHPKTGKRVSIELKYQSAVTDQFKCRAYDAIHMKKQHGNSLLTVMLFAKSTSGISIKGAEAICYPFDRFYGIQVAELLAEGGLQQLIHDIRRYLG